MRFAGKVAIVTGAASGIGLATARHLGQEGARVVLADLDGGKVSVAAEQVKKGGAPEAWGAECNVADEEMVQRVTAGTLDRFGRLDAVMNNAGVMIFKPLEEQTTADWERVLKVDLLGAFYFTKQAFLRMSSGGAIVNVSSIHALETTPLVSAYAAAKAAILSLTRSSSMEGKPRGIRVNAVLPGAVDTPMLWENPNVKSGIEKINRDVLGKPEDLAAVIAFLASEDSAFVDGAAIVVDGGRVGRL